MKTIRLCRRVPFRFSNSVGIRRFCAEAQMDASEAVEETEVVLEPLPLKRGKYYSRDESSDNMKIIRSHLTEYRNKYFTQIRNSRNLIADASEEKCREIINEMHQCLKDAEKGFEEFGFPEDTFRHAWLKKLRYEIRDCQLDCYLKINQKIKQGKALRFCKEDFDWEPWRNDEHIQENCNKEPWWAHLYLADDKMRLQYFIFKHSKRGRRKPPPLLLFGQQSV